MRSLSRLISDLPTLEPVEPQRFLSLSTRNEHCRIDCPILREAQRQGLTWTLDRDGHGQITGETASTVWELAQLSDGQWLLSVQHTPQIYLPAALVLKLLQSNTLSPPDRD